MTALEDLEIATPCSASWDDMEGSARVRRCDLCQLNVYNLSEMTRAAAEELVASTEGTRLCVRMFRRVDGTVITQDCPQGVVKLMHRKMRAAAFWFFAILGLSAAATSVVDDALRPRHTLGQGLVQ